MIITVQVEPLVSKRAKALLITLIDFLEVSLSLLNCPRLYTDRHNYLRMMWSLQRHSTMHNFQPILLPAGKRSHRFWEILRLKQRSWACGTFG